MTASLTTLISRVQAILLDDATLFSTATCTAAIRQALTEINNIIPQFQAVTITGVNNQYEYELTAQDPSAVKILDVLLQGTNQNELDTPLTYDDYNEDERIFFRLRAPITTTQKLIVRYTVDHIINGLDSQVESTLTAREDQTLVDGAAYHALMIRAASRIESNNLDKAASDNYREVAGHFRTAFHLGLSILSRNKRAPVGKPDIRTWNDQYHTWNQ